jgi:hypothetical protein
VTTTATGDAGPKSEAAQLELFTTPAVEAFCDARLPEDALLHLRLTGGEEPLQGLVVEVDGDGLALISVDSLAAWVPYGEGAWQVAAEAETPGAETPGAALRFELPEATLEPGGSPARGDDLRGQAIEEIERRLLDDNRRSVAARLIGRGVAAGEAAVRIRVWTLDGALVSDWCESLLIVDVQPRVPELPALTQINGAERLDLADPTVLALCDLHDGAEQLLAWFAFDDSLLAAEPRFSRWCEALDAALRDAAEVCSDDELPATLQVPGAAAAQTTIGPEGLGASEHEVLLDALAAGGALVIGGEEVGGEVFVRNATLGDPLPEPGLTAAPLELALTVAQPEGDRACARLISALVGVLEQVCAEPSCCGALVCARGADLRANVPLAYELVAGLSLDLPVELRLRPRAPGWRVLVPSAAASALCDHPAVRRREVAAGVLVGSDAPDPFCMDDDDSRAVEQALCACFERKVDHE